VAPEPTETKELVGVDVFLEWREGTPEDLGADLEGIAPGDLELEVITNRGMKVWPDSMPETWVCDQWQCRFKAESPIEHARVIELLETLDDRGFDFVKTEHLYTFDGEEGFTKGQGT
jgi:isocitrate dehydrogenase